jgi:hypothetical protein
MILCGGASGQAELPRVITPVREKDFDGRIIRDSFRNRGICPLSGNQIVKQLQDQLLPIPELTGIRQYKKPTPS